MSPNLTQTLPPSTAQFPCSTPTVLPEKYVHRCYICRLESSSLIRKNFPLERTTSIEVTSDLQKARPYRHVFGLSTELYIINHFLHFDTLSSLTVTTHSFDILSTILAHICYWTLNASHRLQLSDYITSPFLSLNIW